MGYVDESQIDLINRNRLYTIVVMSFSAILLYTVVELEVESYVFTVWLVIILSVDAFQLLAWYSYNKKHVSGKVNYALAKRHILIGTILSGLCWGALSIILLPVIAGVNLMIVILTLVALAIASTTTLSYKYQYSVIFIVLVLAPLSYSLSQKSGISGMHQFYFEIMLFLLLLLLLKNVMTLYYRCKHMLKLQDRSNQREKELIHQTEKAASANHAKSVFLANISHELRTPMHAILGFSSLGLDNVGTASDEKTAKYFSRINQSGKRLLELLNDLLDLSKLEAGHMVFEFSENDLLSTILHVTAELEPLFIDKRLTVDVKPEGVSTVLVYDNNKMCQVVRNIIGNAIKHSPEDECIEISLSSTTIKIDAADVPAISVAIADHGPGIADNELDSVFDEFVQSSDTDSSSGGAGLGLAISREIIKRHSGCIKAENGATGVVIIFTLPYMQHK